MPSFTTHYGLEKLASAEPFSSNGQKYTEADRDAIDRLLYLGAEGHHHTGATVTQSNPASPASLLASTSGGTLPAGTRVYYEYTWVDANGFETAPSPSVYVDLPSQLATPNPPTLTSTSGTGTLAAGYYAYELTAYSGASSTSETAASTPAFISTTATGEVTLFFPTAPSGASGWNIYRRDPNGTNYQFLATVVLGATPPTSYVDNGSVAINCNRIAPNRNTTASRNSVTITLPQSAPSGYTTNLYRTSTTGVWTSSFLANLSTTTFIDTGFGTTNSSPPLASELVGSPSKVMLTNAAEVQGQLPVANVAAFPLVVTFAFPGQVAAQTGPSVWTCDFSSATIVWARASLGVGSTPAAQSVIADVLTGTAGATPTFSTIYTSATKPHVDVGHQTGPTCAPDVTSLSLGDSISADIVQSGGGATPTDSYLTLNVYLLVRP
jgi:hypothetical protein